MYGLLADVVVGIHLGYVAYVVLGQVFILLAGAFAWQCGRNPWFRWSHLTAIGIVAYEAVMNIRCPLTVWEEKLRLLAGQTVNSGETFLGRLLHDLLFIDQYFTGGRPPEAFFTTLYIAVFVIVLQAVLLYPPRRFRRRRETAIHQPALQMA
ncbi:MAG: DUF2784 domain-containing protein [Fimbriiglobus sp.]